MLFRRTTRPHGGPRFQPTARLSAAVSRQNRTLTAAIQLRITVEQERWIVEQAHQSHQREDRGRLPAAQYQHESFLRMAKTAMSQPQGRRDGDRNQEERQRLRAGRDRLRAVVPEIIPRTRNFETTPEVVRAGPDVGDRRLSPEKVGVTGIAAAPAVAQKTLMGNGGGLRPGGGRRWAISGGRPAA